MDMRDQILATAQRLVQQRGFNGFSYADIADDVGIRKASLHHYFPTKADLGRALIDSYTTELESALQRITASKAPADEKLKSYAGIFRASLTAERMCLCGMLATEAQTLDPAMLPGLHRFFSRNTEWLTGILADGNSKGVLDFKGPATAHARSILSLLQGALLIARGTGDHKNFDQSVSLLIEGLTRQG